ncbi:MAG: amidase [Solirubrobacterales bacterium]|nr:amidase [Solirubrobacterales bacterium]
MDPVDLAFAGVARQAELIRSGEISSRELIELYLGRIERINPRINAFTAVFSEAALEEAELADARRGRGEQAPLLGVPIAIKDNIDIAGYVTSFGTGCYDEPASEDAALVQRLRGAGAVIIGKTTLPELAIVGFTETPTWGITRNPWDTNRTTGGSSGGSAAAVAAGLVGAAHASDGAGSIRIPAANNGLFGLKPQRDRVTIGPETEHWHGMSVFGFVTRSVLDTALLLDIATSGEQMPTAPPPPERPFAGAAGADPGRLRIAYSAKPIRGVLPPRLTDDVKRAFSEMIELLSSLGHETSEVKIDFGQTMGNRIIARYLGGIRDEEANVPNKERLEPRTRGFARLGKMLVSKGALAKARGPGAEADLLRLDKLYENHDVLLTPVTGEPPVEIGNWDGKGALRTLLGMSRTYPYTPVWNHTGQPAASVPAGFSDGGLPIGVMLIGRTNDESTLLSLAGQIEAERRWADRRPAIAV